MPRKTNFSTGGHEYFRVTATIGTGPDGKPIRKQFYGSGKKEAEAKRDEYLSNVGKGLAAGYDKALFKDVFHIWYASVLKPTISSSSAIRYDLEYDKRIRNSSLSELKLSSVRSLDVQTYYNGLLAEYSVKTVRLVHRLLTNFFNYCVKSDLVAKNPLFAVELPGIRTGKDGYNVLCRADINKILEAARHDISILIYLFAIFTGLRQGEILALELGDIDLDNNSINVTKSVKHLTINKKFAAVLNPTKTLSSIRSIPILPELKPLLKAHIETEKEKYARLGVEFNNKSIFFSTSTCDYRQATNVLTGLKRLYKRLNIPDTSFHDLRHTFCTLLAEEGVPLKTASVLMGHSDVSITAKIYTHVDSQELKKSIDKLSALFNN